MNNDDKRFTVVPDSTAPEDIAAAILAEKIVNSPAFIEAYEQRLRRHMRGLADGTWIEYWEPDETP